MITICFTYFKSLALANFEAALYALRRQDFSAVQEIVIVDNDTEDAAQTLMKTIGGDLKFPVPVTLKSFKHGDPTKTHPWSANVAVREATTSWVLFTRADYILDFTLVSRFAEVIEEHPPGWKGFVTSNVCHLFHDVAACETYGWRSRGPGVLLDAPHATEAYTCIDAGVWMTQRATFDEVGGLDERLSAWGHAQTHFQYKLHKAGVECVRIPEVLFYHPLHSATRDLDEGHQQLRDLGVDLKEMWARYEGTQPY
jgi:hypothetical protein